MTGWPWAPAVALGAALLGFSTVPGCAAGDAAAFRPEVVEPARAVIYVYRPRRSWGGSPVVVYIDQQVVGRLDAGRYLARAVDAGERLVRVEGQSESVRRVLLSAGGSAFLEVHSSAWDERPVIDEPDEEAARERIAETSRAEDAAR